MFYYFRLVLISFSYVIVNENYRAPRGATNRHRMWTQNWDEKKKVEKISTRDIESLKTTATTFSSPHPFLAMHLKERSLETILQKWKKVWLKCSNTTSAIDRITEPSCQEALGLVWLYILPLERGNLKITLDKCHVTSLEMTSIFLFCFLILRRDFTL